MNLMKNLFRNDFFLFRQIKIIKNGKRSDTAISEISAIFLLPTRKARLSGRRRAPWQTGHGFSIRKLESVSFILSVHASSYLLFVIGMIPSKRGDTL